jgi:hypothetical protein
VPRVGEKIIMVMNTKLKNDGLLDAFEKHQLSKAEMIDLNGGNDCIHIKVGTNSGLFILTLCEDGSQQWTDITGQIRSNQWMIDNNDHF